MLRNVSSQVEQVSRGSRVVWRVQAMLSEDCTMNRPTPRLRKFQLASETIRTLSSRGLRDVVGGDERGPTYVAPETQAPGHCRNPDTRCCPQTTPVPGTTFANE